MASNIDLTPRDFDYELPAALIAQAPLPERSGGRLLLLEAERNQWHDRRVAELPELLRRGDLLVFNDTRVLPARMACRKSTGGRVEMLLERALDGSRALVQLRDSKAVRPGLVLQSVGGAITIITRRGEFWEVELPQAAIAFFEAHGQVPLPPYIERSAQASDRERYQSLFARVPGAVAAPTASLHFDAALLAALSQRGIARSLITLHVGAGTFQPIRAASLSEHVMHRERFEVGAEALTAIARARADGGRVIAVGTTVARALESAALEANAARRALEPVATETALFVRPGFRFQIIDALLTNFHLPQSTLLMLVAALAGRETVLAAYAHAIREGYRFFSYGDAMLIWPRADALAPRDAGVAP